MKFAGYVNDFSDASEFNALIAAQVPMAVIQQCDKTAFGLAIEDTQAMRLYDALMDCIDSHTENGKDDDMTLEEFEIVLTKFTRILKSTSSSRRFTDDQESLKASY